MESSLDNSRRRRLLKPLGPDALAAGSVLRTDSTSKGDNTMLFSGVLTVAGERLGIGAFCSFKIVWLWKKLFKTLALSVSSVYMTSLNSRGGMVVL